MACSNGLPLLAAICLLIGGCAAQPSQPPADAAQSWQNITDSGDWRNPYLIVRADGVEIVGKPGLVSPALIASVLAGLPKDAWPYGRVVAIQESGLQSGNDGAKVKENFDRTVKALKDAGFDPQLWPSA